MNVRYINPRAPYYASGNARQRRVALRARARALGERRECPQCTGDGWLIFGDDEEKCPSCEGWGWVYANERLGLVRSGTVHRLGVSA